MNLDELRAAVADSLCEFPEIELIYLHGSQVTGNVGPMSDVDIAVLITRESAREAILSEFSSAIAKRLQGAPVDCILLNQAAPELCYGVIAGGVLLYECSVEVRVEYEAGVMSRYFDYLPVLRATRRDILEDRNRVTRIQRYREALERTERTLGEIRAAQR